ncbi:MAG: hypothetical protein NTV23_09170 [Propionibacteriales bacterium]|nr:hypothetical protein [Propionibacteriales bacterium]
MSGIDDPGAPPELPEEYADVYRDAYLRALAEGEPVTQFPAGSELDEAEDRSSDSSARLWLLLAGVALVLIVAAYLVGDLLSGDDESPPVPQSQPSAVTGSPVAPTPSSTPTPRIALGPVWDGPVEPVAIESALASCTAPAGVDSANRPVSYASENAIDDDPSTAWRCNGRARGETITLTLPGSVEVGEVGLVPGYAKTDPISGTDRYAENNRITRVRWFLADGVVVDQVLDPDRADRSVQLIRVPRTATSEVTVEIRSVQRGPRNTTAISSVVVAAAV